MSALQYRIHSVESVKSTNTTVKGLARDGVPEGYVLVAASQTNGRGRLNRVFFSPDRTGLYVSVLLRPQCTLPPYALTCMTAAALSETIGSFHIPCGIKWVNDIYVNGKKAAGILTESHLNQDGSFDYAVVGIGVNLFYPENGFPQSISDKATALFSDPPDDEIRKLFLKRLLARFRQYYELLPDIAFFDSYRDKLIGIGNRLLVSEADGVRYGTSAGIDRSFRLLVHFDDGTERALDRGEIEFL